MMVLTTGFGDIFAKKPVSKINLQNGNKGNRTQCPNLEKLGAVPVMASPRLTSTFKGVVQETCPR